MVSRSKALCSGHSVLRGQQASASFCSTGLLVSLLPPIPLASQDFSALDELTHLFYDLCFQAHFPANPTALPFFLAPQGYLLSADQIS